MTKSSRYIRNLNTEDQLSSLEDSLQEYKERLERVASQLELCRSQETEMNENFRLSGKIEGIYLALSYLREVVRYSDRIS